jgi:Ca-activated chloride channel family protein
VFGLRQAKARELGWVGKDIRLADILQAIRSGRLRFLMTSATQSNSGASAYLGFLYALMGNPEIIQLEDLNRPELVRSIKDFLRGIYRTSGSSGWLKELFLKTPEADAMVNYESVLIETNKELIAQGQEPLYFIYPLDGLVIADSPLGFNSQNGAEKEESFLKFQKWLLKPENQNRLLALGRRTGLGGDISNADRKVFNPEWCIDVNRIISPVRMPSPEVIERSLILYQTAFRKPSYSIFVLDYSGSMRGTGEEALKQSMMALIDQDQAKNFMIQAGEEDRWVLIAFSDRIKGELSAAGNSPKELRKMMAFLNETEVGGATDIFTPLVRALTILSAVPNLEDYIPAIIQRAGGHGPFRAVS